MRGRKSNSKIEGSFRCVCPGVRGMFPRVLKQIEKWIHYAENKRVILCAGSREDIKMAFGLVSSGSVAEHQKPVAMA